MLIQDATSRQGVMATATAGTPRGARHHTSRPPGGPGRGREQQGTTFAWLEDSGLGMDHLPDDMPSNFLCPISLEPMKDPVTLCTGQTFERHSIDKWLAAGNITCPTTMQRLTDTSLIPNHTLRHVIEEWYRRQGHKARRTAKRNAAQVNDTSPADVRALLEEISLCKGLEEIVHSKGQGVIMKDLHGQDVRVLTSPDYSDSMWKQAVDASLRQELVDGLLDMDIKEGVHLDTVMAESATIYCDALRIEPRDSWLGGSRVGRGIGVGVGPGLQLNPGNLNPPSPHRLHTSDSSSDEQEDKRIIDGPNRSVGDAHHSLLRGQDVRRLTTTANNTDLRLPVSGLKKLELNKGASARHSGGEVDVKSASHGATHDESARLVGTTMVSTGSSQSAGAGQGTPKRATAKWKDTVVAKWNEIVSQTIRRGPLKAHKARSSTTDGEPGRAGSAASVGSGTNEVAKPLSSSSLRRKSYTMSPIRETRSPEGLLVTASGPSHRRQLSASTNREQEGRSPLSVYDFSCDRVAVDPLTWEDISRPRKHQEFGPPREKKRFSRSPPWRGGTNTPYDANDALHGPGGPELTVSPGKWPLRRWISEPRSGHTTHPDRRRQGKLRGQHHDLVTHMLSGEHHTSPDPSSSPYDFHNMDGFSTESGSLSDFGREISLYSPQEKHVWQGFVSPEQISLLSGPVSPLSVLAASSEMVSPFSRLASTSAGGASPLSGFTSPFPGLASPLSEPLSGPISWPMSGPLSPFSVHSSSRSQSMGSITPPPTAHDDYLPFGQDDGLIRRDLKKSGQGDSLISPAASYNTVHSDDLAASMFPVLYSKHWENPLSSVSAGHGSPISRQLENPALIVGQEEHEFLANPPPSPNKNFPSPVTGHAELSHSGPDGLQAMRLEALKKLHKYAASEYIHRFGMLDETVPVLLTALLPTLKLYNKGDLDDARECANLVVKILVLLMPLTVTAAAQLAEQGVLEVLVELTGEDESIVTRINVVTLLGHMVETLVDGNRLAAAGNGTSVGLDLDAFTFTEGCDAAPRLDKGWSATPRLDRDHDRQLPAGPDQKSISQMVTTIATNRSLLQKVTRLLYTGRRNCQAATASVSTIHLFCTHCNKALLSMIGAGAIPALVDLLPLGVIPAEDRVADRVAKILHLLELACATAEGRLALMHHYRSSIPRLVACLRPKNELRTEVALSVLSSLLAPHESGQSDKLSVAAVEAGAASKLVLLIQSGCSGAIKTKCTELLKYLSNKYSATTMFLYHNNLSQALQ